jgi:hypothetical protein
MSGIGYGIVYKGIYCFVPGLCSVEGLADMDGAGWFGKRGSDGA